MQRRCEYEKTTIYRQQAGRIKHRANELVCNHSLPALFFMLAIIKKPRTIQDRPCTGRLRKSMTIPFLFILANGLKHRDSRLRCRTEIVTAYRLLEISSASFTASNTALRNPICSNTRTPPIVVPAGEHTISFNSPGCFPVSNTIFALPRTACAAN